MGYDDIVLSTFLVMDILLVLNWLDISTSLYSLVSDKM